MRVKARWAALDEEESQIVRKALWKDVSCLFHAGMQESSCWRDLSLLYRRVHFMTSPQRIRAGNSFRISRYKERILSVCQVGLNLSSRVLVKDFVTKAARWYDEVDNQGSSLLWKGRVTYTNTLSDIIVSFERRGSQCSSRAIQC